jgi:hypothetical protein
MPSTVFGQQPLKLSGAFADVTIAVAEVFKFVKYTGDNKVALCSAVTDVPCGVIQAPCLAGEPAEVVAIGETQLQADASLTAGQLIGTSADGQAAHYVPGTDTTKYIVGQVKRVAGGTSAGNFITATVNCVSPARGA